MRAVTRSAFDCLDCDFDCDRLRQFYKFTLGGQSRSLSRESESERESERERRRRRGRDRELDQEVTPGVRPGPYPSRCIKTELYYGGGPTQMSFLHVHQCVTVNARFPILSPCLWVGVGPVQCVCEIQGQEFQM